MFKKRRMRNLHKVRKMSKPRGMNTDSQLHKLDPLYKEMKNKRGIKDND